jgi:hypothetical protein
MYLNDLQSFMNGDTETLLEEENRQDELFNKLLIENKEMKKEIQQKNEQLNKYKENFQNIKANSENLKDNNQKLQMENSRLLTNVLDFSLH